MPSKTIGGSLNHGVTLTTATYNYNPLYVTGTINTAAGDGVQGDNTQSWTVGNTGTIEAAGGNGVKLLDGGTVTNGVSGATSGLISGYDDGVDIQGTLGTVTNFGTILAGANAVGVLLEAGGIVTNGTPGATTARIASGYLGVEIENVPGTVRNFGTIVGTAPFGAVRLDGGVLVNGGSASTAATIDGDAGVAVYNAGASLTLTNFGVITVTGSNDRPAVKLATIGTTANSISNFGTISGNLATGIYQEKGGVITNGKSGASAALIAGGPFGIDITAGRATVTNFATIEGTGSAGVGVYLAAGGTVSDSGTISGTGGTAVSFGGTDGNRLVLDPGYHFDGTVVGSASATNTLELGSAASGGTVATAIPTAFVNFGRVAVDAGARWTLAGSSSLSGIILTDHGTLTNTGTLSGPGGKLTVASATLVNKGSIGLTLTLSGGGYLDNKATGTIAAAGDGVFGTLAAATIVNAGTITGTSDYGVELAAGGTVTNAGYIGGFQNGVAFLAGGTVINQAGAMIGGATSGVGVTSLYTTASVTNAGLVKGVDTGIRMWDGGTVVNQNGGTISGSNSGIDLRGTTGDVTNAGDIFATGGGGINLYYGTVDNQASGTIAGPVVGIAAYAFGFHNPVGAVTVTNAGTVSGGYGVFLSAGGTVTNQSGGKIVGASHAGVFITGDGGTVIDSGTISGGNGTAISFGGTGGNRLVLDPGYHLAGAAIGSTSGGATNTLELGSAASKGTLAGVGTSFVNFGTVTVDAGARWVLVGTNTLGAGATLSNLGTLTAKGKLVDAGTVIGNSRLTVVSGGNVLVVSGGTTRGTGLSGGRETVSAGGTASGGTVISGGRQTISAGGVANGATVKIGGSQIVVSGGLARGTVLSGGSETISAGGTVSGGTIASGGVEHLHGRASGGSVTSGGRQIVNSGGVAIGAVVKHGGNQTVYSGGVTRGTVLSGGVESVHGTASGAIVASSGRLVVLSGGKASGGTIRGGIFEVASGGTASGTVSFVSGGTLQLDATTGFTGKLKGFAVPDRIDLRSVAFGAGTTRKFTEAASNTSGTLTVTDGTRTVHLTLLGSYVTSQFHLTSDGSGGTRVTDPPLAGGASRTTFADLAPAQPLAGATNPGSPPNYLPNAIALNDEAPAGSALFATGPPRGASDLSVGGGADHNSLLPAPR